MDNIDRWAEKLTKSVFLEWKSKYRSWKPGFKVFFGPVKRNPQIMILSYNPGGDKEDFKEDLLRFRKGDFSIPVQNEYFSKTYRIAGQIQRLFGNKKYLVKESVVLPIFFFRSKKAIILKQSFSVQERIEMELFCYKKVKSILKEIKPQKLLILGFDTYEKFMTQFFVKAESERIICGTKGNRIAIKTSWNGIPFFCLIHPTGTWIKSEDWEKARRNFLEFLNHN